MDPLTRRAIRLKSTVETEQQAHIELRRLLKEASEGRTPESGATVAKLMDEYAAVAEWDVSTRQTNEGFIRRTIKPALGPMKVRKVRGPILDKLYAELKRCGDLSCTGRPFIEHRNVLVLAINPRDPPGLAAGHGGAHLGYPSGVLAPGDELPSITELSALQCIGTGVIRPPWSGHCRRPDHHRHGRAGRGRRARGDRRLSRRRPAPATTVSWPGAVRTSVTR